MVHDAIQPIKFKGCIIDDTACELGEGISYDYITNSLWWFDILGKKLIEWQVSSDKKYYYDTPFLGTAIAQIDNDRQLIVADCGLMIRNRNSGLYQHYRTIEDNAQTRANDSRIHQSGALWTSRMGRAAEKGLGAIYHVNNTTTTLLYDNITIANGICFSPQGDIGYFVDTYINRLMRVNLDPKTGIPIDDPVVLIDAHHEDAGIDGAICDNDGLIWCARWGGSCIDVFSPDGKKLKSYLLPAKQITCPAFFGENADRLAATSAWEGFDQAAKRADPAAGQTFDLGISVKGRFEPAFVI